MRCDPLAPVPASRYIQGMDWKEAAEKLKAHQGELQSLGVRHASVFGSTARGEAGTASDVDVAVEFDAERIPHGFGYASHLDTVQRRLSEILRANVECIAEPARRRVIQEAIDRERRRVF